MDERDNVRILLDAAGLAKVGQLRMMVGALLNGTRELREREDRDVQVSGDGLQLPRDFAQLLHAVVVPVVAP